MHDILLILAGIITTPGMFLLATKLKKKKKNPINLINNILLPNVDDPDWYLSKFDHDPKFFELKNGNVAVRYTSGSTMNNLKEFSPKIFTSTYIIASGKEAYDYVKAVRYFHMKYLVENPELKQLEAKT